MAEGISIDELAEAMFVMVQESAGVKKLKPTDLIKAMIERFGTERCTKEICKEALRRLMDSGRTVYTYFGGTYVELPHEEGAAA